MTFRRSWLSVALYFAGTAAATTFAGYVRSDSRSGVLVPFVLGLFFLGLKSLWDIRVPYIIATPEQLQVNPQGKPSQALLWSDVLCTYLVDGDRLAIMRHDESVEWVSLGPLFPRDRCRLIARLEESGLISNRPSGREA